MSELIKKEDSDVQIALMEIVKRKDIDPERLEKFMDLQIKMEERQNEKRFNLAMSEFQGLCPIIKRNKKVSFNSVNYSYAPLDEIVHIAKPFLSQCGLSYSFNSLNKGDGESVLVMTVSHIDGYKKDFEYTYATLQASDQKLNTSQQRKSALSYAKRALFENALGLVTAGEDDDAARASDSMVTKAQSKELDELIESTKSNKDRLLKFLNVSDLALITSVEADKAIKLMRQKRIAALQKKEVANV